MEDQLRSGLFEDGSLGGLIVGYLAEATARPFTALNPVNSALPRLEANTADWLIIAPALVEASAKPESAKQGLREIKHLRPSCDLFAVHTVFVWGGKQWCQY